MPTDTPTPGETAYTAYMRAKAGTSLAQTVDWGYDRLHPSDCVPWEAAAQAVRTAAGTARAAPARATTRHQQWAQALALLVETIRQLPHEPDIASALEQVWVLLHTLRDAEESTHA